MKIVILLSAIILSISTSVFAAQELKPPAEWDSLDIPGLAKLARELQGPKKPAEVQKKRRLLANYVAGRYRKLSENNQVRWDEWLNLADAIGNYLPKETKPEMADDLAGALVSSRGAIRALKPEVLIKIAGILSKLRDRSRSKQICEEWITGTDKYKTLSLAHIADISVFLRPVNKWITPAQRRLAGIVTSKYLENKEIVRSLDCGKWQDIVASLHIAMTEKQREQWRNTLRAVFIDKNLSAEDIYQLAMAMSILDDTNPADFISEWMAGNNSWQQWRPDGVSRVMCWLYRDSQSAKSARQKIISWVNTNYLADSSKVQSLSGEDWATLAFSFRKHLTPKQREEWARKLSEAFWAKNKNVKVAEVFLVSNALRNLGKKDISAFVSGWIKRHDTWRSWEIDDISFLAEHLGASEAAKAGGDEIVAHIAAKYQTDSKAVRLVSACDWRDLSRSLGKYLSEKQRKDWLQKLEAAFTFKKIPAGDCLALLCARQTLGPKNTADYLSVWMRNNKTWQSWSIQELAELAGYLRGSSRGIRLEGDSEDIRQAMQKLISHISQKCLVSNYAGRFRAGEWLGLVGSLKGYLSDEQGKEWVRKLKTVFVEKEISAADIQMLVRSMQSLGAENSIDFVSAWMDKHNGIWQSWKIRDLATLADCLKGNAEKNQQYAKRLASHISRRCLYPNDASKRFSVTDWYRLARSLKNYFPEEQRKSLAKRIWAMSVTKDQPLGKMSPAKAYELLARLRNVDQDECARLIFAHMDVFAEGTGFQPYRFRRIVSWAAASNKTKALLLMDKYERVWLSKKDDLSWEDCGEMVYGWRAVGNQEKSQAWAMRMYEKVDWSGEPENVQILDRVSGILRNTGLTGKKKGFKKYASSVAIHAQKGKLGGGSYWTPLHCGSPLGTDETKGIVEAVLVDKHGIPRLEVGKMLACAYRHTGELQKWNEKIKSRVATSEGDAKASWLIMLAYAESLIPHETSPLRGKKWLDQAISMAKSPLIRGSALRDIVNGYCFIGKYQAGNDVLDQFAKRFPDDAKTDLVPDLRENIKLKKVQGTKRIARHEAKTARGHKNIRRGQLRRRLGRAKTRGDQEAVRKIEAQLEQLN